MPIDPYAALNAMLRAEVSRFAPPVRQAEPIAPPKTPAPAAEDEGDPQETAAASARPVGARSATGGSAA
ncbi:hypothetical protein ADK53_01610 [Streptomyces sp. WM6373]|uniref:hypothetical protein n=1 Tax=Streptomyces TaxID=1883 RepID=UPI0004C5369D|nr:MULTISPECIES: hypothetical protein [unclassified Streptomyces]KJY23411.1 hypothetical protein VR43_01350 [Streptomyces sp. NRRL S-104]KOU44335.1 hypothetical protein ADK53_01610 [Streptomyces sp. WM6373]KOU64598.1 hypothetical protein ADK96_21490 [Streptomyces sp. IGB124]KOU79794.1 hypothetical protein ADK61_11150 [Streptomyces sp. XY66]KOU87296.1 hypothetical protein ADK93_17210 [Streptomyces sp. XY58]